ncbi:MAG: HD domain-containing protein [Candidatus Gastranaerophilales bacterium]|nr:HD domain-containing protein [Candidatus Gastranaerophilales bacterium]
MKNNLKNKIFSSCAIQENHEKWIHSISRLAPLSHKPFEIRSEFDRDNTRILHSSAYRRLKHKTQVFFATNNDHVCTRIEHVNHVASISKTIANALGLNVSLAEAIALGHDLGHSPFGHHGERVIERIMDKNGFEKKFWHEKNSLRFVDYIETLPNYSGYKDNLNLTYAVRDGIVCHCGEVNENCIKPRDEYIDLELIEKGKYMPYTYEGCVVKISDKIAYLGRDIEDAYTYKFFEKKDMITLKQLAQEVMKKKIKFKDVNTSSLIHEFITNLCLQSNPEEGLKFSKEHYDMMNKIKKFNYQKIYTNPRFKPFLKYADLIINTIFDFLFGYYFEFQTIEKLNKYSKFYPTLTHDFSDWLIKYSNIDEKNHNLRKYRNKIIYDITNVMDYKQAIIDYISGMSDNYAIKAYSELIEF